MVLIGTSTSGSFIFAARRSSSVSVSATGAALVPLAAGLFVLGAWSIIPLQTYHSRALAEARLFGGMAEMLQQNAKPGETLLAEPIGFIGWYNPDLRIVDETGDQILAACVASGHSRAAPTRRRCPPAAGRG